MDRLRITTYRTMVLVLMYASFTASPLHAGPRASRSRCEYPESPLGIDATNPRFAWMIGDQKRGLLQFAYQILVATNLDDLHADVGDMWDSGKVQSDQSSQIVYAGKALASRTRYYWKVCVWNQSGQLSEYSEPTWWEMGLLQPEDWVGNWIEPEGGVPALSVTDEYETMRLPELSNVFLIQRPGNMRVVPRLPMHLLCSWTLFRQRIKRGLLKTLLEIFKHMTII